MGSAFDRIHLPQKNVGAHAVDKMLDPLPPTVQKMYERLLDETNQYEDETTKLLATFLLRWISTAMAPKKAEDLVQALSLSVKADPAFSVRAVLNACNQFLILDSKASIFSFGPFFFFNILFWSTTQLR